MRYLVDANLLVLLVVGLTRLEAVGRHKRLKTYRPADFERLLGVLGSGTELAISAYVMAEASNLVVQGVGEPLRSDLRDTLKPLAVLNPERHVLCAAAASRREFAWLGLTDAAVLERCDDDCTLVTSDLELAAAASMDGRRAIYFGPAEADVET